MKQIIILLLLFMSLGILSKESTSSDTGKKLGVGISLFSPTGITGKYWLDDKKTLEGTLGIGYQEKWGQYLHFVFLYNFAEIKPSLYVYAGGGISFSERYEKLNPGRGRFVERDHYFFSPGLRIPIGITYMNREKNFEIYGELAINIYLNDRSGFGPGIAIGARYYF